MDDWQETQLTNRHVHNRVGKGSKRNGGGKSGGVFNVSRTFGTYQVRCRAAEEKSGRDFERGQGQGGASRLEIYTLNERGNAVVGEMLLEGVVHARVLLAPSRKVMNSVVRELEAEAKAEVQEEEEEEEEEEGEKGREGEMRGEGASEEDVMKPAQLDGGKSIGKCDDGDDGDEEEDEDENENTNEKKDIIANQRVREFEKNGFRYPKFWLKWQGSLLSPTATDSSSLTSDKTVTDTGYIVFSGNHCDAFRGTISCEPLGWDNVTILGAKIKPQPARDFAMTWAAE